MTDAQLTVAFLIDTVVLLLMLWTSVPQIPREDR
jgi:hypothetical protein